MDNRRVAIVAGLGVAELWIVGMMFRSLCGGGGHEVGYAATVSNSPFAAMAGEASGGRLSKTMDTGPAPHVVIDDDDATLTVSVRPGSTVAVNEETDVRGWVRGSQHPVTMERTGDGVEIVRSGNGLVVSMGLVRRRLDVVVPPAARLDVKNAGSTTISGLRADAAVHSDDGSIVVSDVHGAVSVRTDDGRIELHSVDGPSVDVNSENGRVLLDRVRALRVAVTTDDGRIEVVRSLLGGGKIQTNNGRISLELDPRSDVTVKARASSGKVIAQAPLIAAGGSDDDDDDSPSTIRVGSGSGQLDVGSDDGSILVSAGGVYGS
jgi:hypothetical protein